MNKEELISAIIDGNRPHPILWKKYETLGIFKKLENSNIIGIVPCERSCFDKFNEEELNGFYNEIKESY